MPYFLKGNCVWSGTEESPGKEVKCHEDHAAAVAHMRALYANVEDADEKAAWDVEIEKGGRGSGWHNPPEGTHTAENAPNFAGGPGADREYGTESDEPPKGSKLCKCTKCSSTFTLPKGKQCEDVKCPGCGGGATQTSPRKDPKAEGEGGKKALSPDGTGAVHGQGSILGEFTSVMGDTDAGCKCPHCGKGLPCTAKACPHCKEKIDKVERGESDKAFTIYKSADGSWRWMTLSSWAVVDKEREVVSEQAYRDAIAYAQKHDTWGEMDLIHVDGTDVGDCDTLFILKSGDDPAKLGAGGTWYDTLKATRARKVIQAEPGDWGVSLKFRFNPDRLVRGVYTGDIQVLKHSILPQEMAASYGTAIAVQGGNMSKQLDEKAAEALAQLGHTPEEIAELAEKQKALPEEANVVTKEEDTTQEGGFKRLWQELGKKLFSIEAAESVPDASTPDEARKADEVEGDPAPADKQVDGDAPEAEKAGQEDASTLMRAFGEQIGKMVKDQLDERDKRIADLEAQVAEMSKSVEEKVEERLRDVPQVVTVAPSQVAATATDEPVKGLTFGQKRRVPADVNKQLVDDIKQLVDDKMRGAGFQV